MSSTATPSPFAWLSETVRQPEALVLRWRDRHGTNEPKQDQAARATQPGAFLVLAIVGTLGLATYGVTMGLPAGLGSVGRNALLVPGSALIAWCLCLPSLYIVYSALGATIDRSTVLLAALATFCFGSLARLASAPLSWFFGVALPFPGVLTVVHLLVFGVTAIAMLFTFVRVMRTVAPNVSRLVPLLWLVCVGAIDAELKLLLSVFVF